VKYRVDAKVTKFFDSLAKAREFAKDNFPAIIMKREQINHIPLWREIERFDRFYNEEKKEWSIGFF
jgi:hypothetical protein